MKTIKQKAIQQVGQYMQMVSDIDYSYNEHTQQWDVPAVQWDGAYGSYWTKYESEQARTQALQENERNFDAEVCKVYKQLVNAAAMRYAQNKQATNTLGNMCPQLAKLAS